MSAYGSREQRVAVIGFGYDVRGSVPLVDEDGIRIDKCVCDDFVQDALITIEFSEVFDENFGCNLCHDYLMVSEDENWIYCKREN